MKRILVVSCLLYYAAIGASVAQQPTSQTTSESRSGTVLITGANRGLGLELARQYADRGWTVIATARDTDAAAELRELAASRTNVSIETLDVRDADAIRMLAAKHQGRPIDVLINNAGVLGDLDKQSLGSLDYNEFEQVIQRCQEPRRVCLYRFH